jgi:hypothetical protein
MRAVLIATALIAAPLSALAGPVVERIDVLDAGTYAVETGAATADPTVPMGETVAVTKATLLTAGTTLPATLGTDFGFRYVAIGVPQGETVPLDFVITYPAPGLADPDAAAPITSARFTREKTIGTPDYLGYLLEAPWEAIPGPWHFEIWHDGRKLAEQTFTLTAPP